MLPQILDIVKKLLNPQRCSIMLVDNDEILKIKIGDNISPTAMREAKLNVTKELQGKFYNLLNRLL